MTALPPDPDPDRTPGLAPGGGVRPGDTPPESGSTTPGLSKRESYRSRKGGIAALVVVSLVALAVIGFLIVQLVG